jgi:predicted dehydrogenase
VLITMDKIGIGILGWGTISKTHLIALRSMEIIFEDLKIKPNILGLCTRGGRSDIGEFRYVTKDIKELLSKEDIDMIDICTPNFLHLQQAKAVIDAGKHIYIEKPMAKNLEECKEIVNLCKEKDLINQSALMYRFMPAVVMARDYIQSGQLGEILNFRVSLYHKGYLNSERPMSWRLQQEMSGGGALMDLGIHLADTLRFLIGEAKEVRAKTHTHFTHRYKDESKTEKMKADVEEWALLDLTMDNGSHGTMEVSRINSDLSEETIFDIYGTKGKLTISTKHPDYPEIYDHLKGQIIKGTLERISDFSKYHLRIYPGPKFNMGWHINSHLSSLINMMTNINCGKILYKETPTLEEALRSQKIIEMGYISAREQNRIVSIKELD